LSEKSIQIIFMFLFSRFKTITNHMSDFLVDQTKVPKNKMLF